MDYEPFVGTCPVCGCDNVSSEADSCPRCNQPAVGEMIKRRRQQAEEAWRKEEPERLRGQQLATERTQAAEAAELAACSAAAKREQERFYRNAFVLGITVLVSFPLWWHFWSNLLSHGHPPEHPTGEALGIPGIFALICTAITTGLAFSLLAFFSDR